jgi:putative peptidoglycan lipid II flippase
MFFKHLNSESKTVVGAAMLLGLFSFASRIVGLIRDRILSGEFGAGDVLDAYYAAFKLPDFVYNLLIVGAISASFIPLFIKALQTKEKEAGAWRFTSNVLNILGVFSLIVVVLMAIFVKPLAGVIAPGFTGEKHELVVTFTRILLVGEFLLSLSVVFGSVLQGLKRFFLYAVAPIFYNLGIIVGALWLVPLFGPSGLAWGVVLGTFAHFLIQALGVFAFGFKYSWIFDLKDKAIREVVRLTGPRVLGLAVTQVNVVVTTMLASLLPAGGLTMFNFANNIAYFPIGIIGVSYAVAIFPSLSEHAE